MKTFEQKIAETVNEKLNDGTVEKLVEQTPINSEFIF